MKFENYILFIILICVLIAWGFDKHVMSNNIRNELTQKEIGNICRPYMNDRIQEWVTDPIKNNECVHLPDYSLKTHTTDDFVHVCPPLKISDLEVD